MKTIIETPTKTKASDLFTQAELNQIKKVMRLFDGKITAILERPVKDKLWLS